MLVRNRVRVTILLLVALAAVSSVIGFVVLNRSHTSTPNPTASPPEIRMSYSTSYPSTVGGASPMSGFKFLLINLTAENRGYHNFTVIPFRDMYVHIIGDVYNISALSPPVVDNAFPPSNLKDTQSQSGNVLFEIPNGASFSPGWTLQANEQIKIEWVGL